MIALPRSSYYYQARERAVALTDTELEELIGTIQDELPGYGYRRNSGDGGTSSTTNASLG